MFLMVAGHWWWWGFGKVRGLGVTARCAIICNIFLFSKVTRGGEDGEGVDSGIVIGDQSRGGFGEVGWVLVGADA